jgi:hypothetical protein
MWYKLSIVMVVNICMILVVIPIKTHALLYDGEPFAKLSFFRLLIGTNFTLTAKILISIIVIASILISIKIIRDSTKM